MKTKLKWPSLNPHFRKRGRLLSHPPTANRINALVNSFMHVDYIRITRCPTRVRPAYTPRPVWVVSSLSHGVGRTWVVPTADWRVTTYFVRRYQFPIRRRNFRIRKLLRQISHSGISSLRICETARFLLAIWNLISLTYVQQTWFPTKELALWLFWSIIF